MRIEEIFGPREFVGYSYTLNNPVKYIDPSGHWPTIPPLPDPFVPLLGKLKEVAVGVFNYIKNAPPIRTPRASQPSSNNVTAWTAVQITHDTNSAYASNIRGNLNSFNPEDRIEALRTWVSLVRTEGIWDYKVDLSESGIVDLDGNINLGGHTTNWQAVANYTYGATAASVGMPQWMAQGGAGVFQYIDNDKQNRGGLDTFFDDPFDFWWIGAGYDLWKTYGDDKEITATEIGSHITNYLETHGTPPDPLSLGRYIQ